MKKVSVLFVAIIIFLSAFQGGVASADDAIHVIHNGQEINFDTPPILQNGRVLVPIRAIAEALGVDIYWMGDELQTVMFAAKDGKNYFLKIGSNIVEVHDRSGSYTIEIDVPATIQNGRTLVPLRFIAESFDMDVKWYGETRTVTINPPGMSDKTYSNFNFVFLGPDNTFMITDDNTLFAVGYNPSNKTAPSTELNVETPYKIDDDVLMVVHGSASTFYLKTDNTLWGYGSNFFNTIAPYDYNDPDTMYRDQIRTPVKIMDDVKQISASDSETVFAVKTDGTLWGWGNNTKRALGAPTLAEFTPVNTPLKIMDDVLCVAAGYECTFAIKTDGSLWGWGSNITGNQFDGAVGTGTSESFVVKPTQIMDNIKAISVVGRFALALDRNGNLYGWGDSVLSQVLPNERGDIDFYVPIPTKLMDGITDISAGGSYSLAIKNDNTLWGWGNNSGGLLADGWNAMESGIILYPQKIMDNVKFAVAGIAHTACIKLDGTMWAWGNNSYGQLGVIEIGSTFTPVQVIIE